MAFSFAAPFFVACLAALVAHYAIDLAGDVLLPRDSYDDLPHESRAFAFAGAALLGIASLIATFRLAVAEARGNSGIFRAAVAASLPLRFGSFAPLCIVATLVAVGAMGALDDAIAGRAPDSVAELFGGSLALGAGITACCGFVFSVLCTGIAALLARAHRSIVGVVYGFVRAARTRLMRDVFARRTRLRGPRAVAARLARRAAGRAPPLASQ